MSKKKIPKLLAREKKALEIARGNPDWNKQQISKEMMRLGYTKNRSYVTHRVAKNNYLGRDLVQIWQEHERRLAEVQMPLAQTVTEQALRSRKMTLSQKHPYTKLVYDKYFGERDRPPTHQEINFIGIQNVVRTDFEAMERGEAIDVTPVGTDETIEGKED